MTSSPSPQIDRLIAEVEALKRRLRFYGRAAAALIVAGAGAATLLAVSPLQSQVARAVFSEITLVDSAGRTRGVWSGETGIHLSDSAVSLYNAAGVRRMVLNVAGNQPSVQFLDVQGRARMALNLSPAGESQIAQTDDQGKQRVLLATDAQRVPKLAMTDPNGNRRALVTVEDNEPMQVFFAPDGKYRLYLNGGNFPRTVLFDAAGKVRSVSAVDNDNIPFLALNDAAETRRYLVNVDKDDATQNLLDAAGRLRVQLSASVAAFLDAESRLRGMVSVNDGGAAIALKDADGNTIWQAPTPAAAP